MTVRDWQNADLHRRYRPNRPSAPQSPLCAERSKLPSWHNHLRLNITHPPTLSTVGLFAHPPHSPCPCCRHVHVRCWRVGTIPVHQTLVDATEHRLIERWVERTERWLYRWYYPRIKRQWLSCFIGGAPLRARVFHEF